MSLQAPFPWFGGKSKVAGLVWERFGDVPNYVEPFFGSGAVLLGRQTEAQTETVNDIDGFVANFWRAVSRDPEAVADLCNHPANENDLHARHSWLVKQADLLARRLEGDPEYYDTKIAGWWCWGLCCWIGSGFCSGNGPWSVVDGKLLRLEGKGRGTQRARLHLGTKGQGVLRDNVPLLSWIKALSDRLRNVRVCCGDWQRICGPSPTTKLGVTGVFLDPPYGEDADRRPDLYAQDDLAVATRAAVWAREHGDDPLMRIALCGYQGEHDMPDTWSSVNWKAKGGYGSQGNRAGRTNSAREVIWFSPHCYGADLFDAQAAGEELLDEH